MRRARLGLLLVTLLALGLGTPAAAHDDGSTQARYKLYGDADDHLPASRANVELVGQLTVSDAADGRIADVNVYNGYAYLAAYALPNCQDTGVYVIDIHDPALPEEVGFLPTTSGSFVGEGVQVIRVDTPAFHGDLLLHNNEVCGSGGKGGLSLWDVTDPRDPQPLARHVGDVDEGDGHIHQIHSTFGWQAGERAFAVMVDDEEESDVDIMEISDPLNPVLISETGLLDWRDAWDTLAHGDRDFFHDVVVKQIDGRWLMLVSYWDAGWVKLDVTDPAHPLYLGDSDYAAVDPLTRWTLPEGNAHQAEFSPDSHYIIANDEDVSPTRVDFRITTGRGSAGSYPADEFSWAMPLAELDDPELDGPTLFGGSGCGDAREQIPSPDRLRVGDGQERILVLLSGDCAYGEQVAAAEDAGYDAVLIANHHRGSWNGTRPDAYACGPREHDGDPNIPALCIGHNAFHRLFSGAPPNYEDGGREPLPGARGEQIRASRQFDAWGYVHLLDATTFQELDDYAVPEALDPAFANDYGSLSVHEVAVDWTTWGSAQGLAYLSYYDAGFRVIRYGPDGIEEVGHFIADGGNDFWGVEVYADPAQPDGPPLVLASDRDSGLWIFRYRPDDPAAPADAGPPASLATAQTPHDSSARGYFILAAALALGGTATGCQALRWRRSRRTHQPPTRRRAT